jgi:hypothetical protein
MNTSGGPWQATNEEIVGLFYLKSNRKIAQYLGVSEERVAKVRARHEPMIAAAREIQE